MKLKKIIAAAMVGSLTVWSAPITLPNAAQSIIVSEVEAAKGGARIAPKPAPSAPKPSSSTQSGSQSKSVSGNGEGYAPSKSANQLDKNAPAAGAKANTAGAASAAKKSSGCGNTLRNIGLLAGGMMLGGLLASMFGMGGGMLADILGVLANIAIAIAAFIAIRWLWNRFRTRKEENVYRNAAAPQQTAPQQPIMDIRPQGAPAPRTSAMSAGTQMDIAGESPRSVADRYRSH